MAKSATWKTVACPRCHTEAGQNCFRPSGSFGLVCPERHALAQSILSPQVPSMARTLVDPAIKHRKRKWSRACRTGRVDLCHGFRFQDHRKFPCENPLHQRSDFRTVAEQASIR